MLHSVFPLRCSLPRTKIYSESFVVRSIAEEIYYVICMYVCMCVFMLLFRSGSTLGRQTRETTTWLGHMWNEQRSTWRRAWVCYVMSDICLDIHWYIHTYTYIIHILRFITSVPHDGCVHAILFISTCTRIHMFLCNRANTYAYMCMCVRAARLKLSDVCNSVHRYMHTCIHHPILCSFPLKRKNCSRVVTGKKYRTWRVSTYAYTYVYMAGAGVYYDHLCCEGNDETHIRLCIYTFTCVCM